MAYDLGSTIVAVATPAGRAALGIIRLTGPASHSIAVKLCPALASGIRVQQAAVCELELPLGTDQLLTDKCVVVCWGGPNSYTGDDMVEISLHGNPILLARTVDRCLELGVRHAEAGEFTYRAYLNNKLDLVQAEAVQELIQAGSIRALQLAGSSITGLPSQKLMNWEERLTLLLADIEVIHDYAADDLDATLDPALLVSAPKVIKVLDRLIKEMEDAVAVSSRMAPLRDGISIAICGPSNAGKSTLFNRLLGHDRALTAPQPGTTRDYLTESLQTGGFQMTLVDTAGYRDAAEGIEEAGIRHTSDWAETADVVLWVVSALEPGLEIPDQLNRLNPQQVVTQCDRLDTWPEPQGDIIHISGLTGAGIPDLLAEIEARLPSLESGALASFSNRQSGEISATRALLEQALASIEADMALDAVAMDLYAARKTLHGVYRQEDPEAVINHIFSDFCVGK